MSALAGPAQAKWLKAETPHFVLYGDVSNLKAYAERLELFDATLRLMHGMDPTAPAVRKLPVYIAGDFGEFKRVMPWANPNVGGVYEPGRHDIFAVARQLGDGENTVLFHEYTHHFMLQYFPAGYPLWLVEGYAEYFQATDINSERVATGGFNNWRDGMLQWPVWLPLKTVLTKHAYDLSDGFTVAQFYAESWLLTHYFLSDALSDRPVRVKQLSAFLAATRAGTEPVAAMEKATGMPIDELDRRLHDYFHRRLSSVTVPRGLLPQVKVEITPLPDSTGELLFEHQALMQADPSGRYQDEDPDPAKAAKQKAERADQNRALLAAVRARAARLRGDLLADDTLARAELYLGDPATGRAVLARRLAADPNDQEALELSAEDLMAQGRAAASAEPAKTRALYEQAYALLARSYKLGVRYQTTAGLAQARQVLDARYPSDNTLETLLFARELAPQVPELRLDAAEGLMMRGRLDAAREMLIPLLNEPHARKASERAHELAKQIDAQRASAGRGS